MLLLCSYIKNKKIKTKSPTKRYASSKQERLLREGSRSSNRTLIQPELM